MWIKWLICDPNPAGAFVVTNWIKKYRSLIGEKYAIFDIKKCDFQNYFSKYEKAPVGFKLIICNSLAQTLTTWLHSN